MEKYLKNFECICSSVFELPFNRKEMPSLWFLYFLTNRDIKQYLKVYNKNWDIDLDKTIAHEYNNIQEFTSHYFFKLERSGKKNDLDNFEHISTGLSAGC